MRTHFLTALVAALVVASSLIALTVQGAEVNPLPAGLLSYTAPRFPAALRGVMAGDGHVVLAMTVNEQGRLLDSVALEATHEAFAVAALAAVAQWQFDAQVTDTLPRRELTEFNFYRNGVITTLTHAEAAQQSFAVAAAPMINTVQAQQLSAQPMRVKATMPALKRNVAASLATQPVQVSFVIDTEGRVRVPVVNRSADPQVAEAVLNAVRQWRYEPVQHQGRPVLVQISRSFTVNQ